VTEDERDAEVRRLQAALAEAKARRTRLMQEVLHLTARLPEIRKEFGNPFYYSRPDEPDEGIANCAELRRFGAPADDDAPAR
jgi:hypothetical protein